jgi:hypothetical protein
MLNPYVLIGIAIALAASFWTGWETHGWKYDSERVAALEADRKAQAEAYAGDVAAAAKRIADGRKEDQKTETIIKTVTEYVREDSDYCGMRLRAVRVFDAGRTGEPLPPAGGADSPIPISPTS